MAGKEHSMTDTIDLSEQNVQLNIVVNDDYYDADAIEHGRLARTFFKSLAKNVFIQSYRYWEKYHQFAGLREIPLLHSERNLYSIVGSAINAITPVHLSEWPLPMPEQMERERRVVDFWCMDKPSTNGKALNYFVELKKAYYCVSTGTVENLTCDAANRIREAIEQVRLVKSLQPDWNGDGNVYMAVPVIHGYHSSSRSIAYNNKHLIECLNSLLDGRNYAQLITSTWTLPAEMEIQWNSDKCDFVMIAGIVLTQKR